MRIHHGSGKSSVKNRLPEVVSQSMVLDTNLLVLLVVGITDRALITKHKKLKAFLPADFDLLSDLIKKSQQLVVTPNTLTESSNRIEQIDMPARTRNFVISELILETHEDCLASNTAVQAKEFIRLGLTDSVLLDITDKSRFLLTTDLDLYLAALHRGESAFNFNHIRLAAFDTQ